MYFEANNAEIFICSIKGLPKMLCLDQFKPFLSFLLLNVLWNNRLFCDAFE